MNGYRDIVCIFCFPRKREAEFSRKKAAVGNLSVSLSLDSSPTEGRWQRVSADGEVSYSGLYFIRVRRSGAAYSWLLYSSTISSTLVSRGLPGRQASA